MGKLYDNGTSLTTTTNSGTLSQKGDREEGVWKEYERGRG